MLTIPLDGPTLNQRRVVVLTTYGMLKGLVLDEDDSRVWLLVNGSQQVLKRRDIRTIAAV